MPYLHRNVPILALCVCLMMSSGSLIVASAALVGYALAEDKSLATLPLAAQFVATMCTSVPAAMLMQKIGRKTAFMLSTGFGMLAGVLTSGAILIGSFWLFVLGTASLGIFNGFSHYYRYAAADSVEVAHKSRAISYVMLGGVAAAVVGPNLAALTREWVAGAEFAGSYMAIIALYVLILGVLSFLRLDDTEQRAPKTMPRRPTRAIVAQPKYMVAVLSGMLGYGVMSLVMTATPLAMEQRGFRFGDTSLVIQWHILAMFAPSFVTGSLIARFGVLRILAAGALLGGLCVLINLMGTSLPHFLFALICLGMSWNFLFVGATVLLTDTYEAHEKNRAQAINDLLVFTSVALASLSAGALQNAWGWRMVNIGVVPLLGIVLLSILWLAWKERALAGLPRTTP